jgi:hypothetical protein
MYENFIPLDKSTQIENLSQQVLKVLAGKDSNQATLKFISKLQPGKIFDAVFLKNIPGGKGVLSLEGNKVTVELPRVFSLKEPKPLQDFPAKSLNKGQKMTVRVESSGGSKLALKIIPVASHENRSKNVEVTTSLTSRGKIISRIPNFENFSSKPSSTDGLTTARVVSAIDSKSILVETGIKSLVIPVEKSENFKPGAQVRIYTEKTENGQKPALFNSGANASSKLDFNALKPYLPARMPIGEMAHLLNNKIFDSPVLPDLKINSDLIVRLRDTLRLLLPGEGEIPSATKVRQQVELSGINYESKVRQVLEAPSGAQARKDLAGDLKGLLLELYHSTEQASSTGTQKSSGPLPEFRNTIKYALDNIELNQLSSQISKQENQPLVIQIPNPLSPGNKTIQLFVRNDSSKDGDDNEGRKNSHNVAFFLDLSFLGKIKINAQMNSESLSVSIDVESEDIANFIRQRTSDFEETMHQNEIDTSVECYVNDKVKPEKDSLIDLLVNNNTSLINIKT